MSRQRFFNGFNVFFRFLTEICLRTPIKSIKKEVIDPKCATSAPSAPCLKLQSGNYRDILSGYVLVPWSFLEEEREIAQIRKHTKHMAKIKL